jgi:hypothetical protein
MTDATHYLAVMQFRPRRRNARRHLWRGTATTDRAAAEAELDAILQYMAGKSSQTEVLASGIAAGTRDYLDANHYAC